MSELKNGDRVREIFNGQVGTILKIWNGEYTNDIYEGKQYNPYRIIVQFDNSVAGILSNGTVNYKAEHLEKI